MKTSKPIECAYHGDGLGACTCDSKPTDNETELRKQVERLIIENRNSLNDPTTNEPYDVKGIADDVVALITSDKQRLLKGLMEQFPEKGSFNFGGTSTTVSYRTQEDAVQHGFNQGIDQAKSVIQNKLEGLS